MKRVNPTLVALSKAARADREGMSKANANRAAADAVVSPPPASSDVYQYEHRLVAKARSQIQNPAYFSAELKLAAVIGLVGLLLLTAPLIFGITGGALLVAAFGIVMASHAADQIFLKDVPAHIDDISHAEAVDQLKVSGEGNRKPIGLLGSIFIMSMCGIEGFLNADSVVAILGETRMTPATVRIISMGLTVLVAYGLYKAMVAAAHEKRANEARRIIQHLENTDQPKADAMKARLGPALDHQYAPIHQTSRKQVQFWSLFFTIMVLSLGLRIGFLLMPHTDEAPNTPTNADQMIFRNPNTTTSI